MTTTRSSNVGTPTCPTLYLSKLQNKALLLEQGKAASNALFDKKVGQRHGVAKSPVVTDLRAALNVARSGIARPSAPSVLPVILNGVR
jgi:hypothetical protein